MRSGLRVFVAVCALFVCASRALAEEAIPRPAGLEPNVRFWERVYSEVGSEGGLIHDSERMEVVYQKLIMPSGLSNRARERRIEAVKSSIRADLRVLAQGRRSGLTPSQQEILALWPEGVSDATLRRAADNVRFQLGQADKFRAGLERSGAWLPHIEQSLRDHGVPPEIAALPHVESSFNPKAYSRVGAAGLWQFTRSTGRLFLRIDSVVDDRLDPFAATDAAARLLVKNYQITGTWPLAITAYNHGAAGMRRATKTLGTTDITTIVREYRSRTFGFASRNFYASFLAALAIERRAEEVFGHIARHTPVDYTVIELPSYYRASSLAAALGVDRLTLQEHNNALRPAVWEGQKLVPRGYRLRVPSAVLDAPAEQLLASVPDAERFAAQHRDRYHTVHRGETLSSIARRYGVSEGELVALNHLRSRHRIRVGQVLTLPGNDEPIEVARQPLPDDGIYTVRRGDNLHIIGRRFGVSEAELVQANALASRHRIYVGQRLVIPGGAAPVVVAQATGTTAPAAQPASFPAPGAPAPAIPAVAETPPAPQVVAVVSEPDPVVEPEPAVGPELVPAVGPELEPAVEPELEPAVEPEPAPAVEPALEAGRALEGEPALEPDPEPVVVPEPAETVAAVEPPVEPAPTADPAAAPELDPEVLPDPEPMAILPAQGPAGPPDPSDYAVHDDRVTVQAEETLGHYAEWLEVSASRLRQANRMRYGQPLVIGRRVRLDFSRVTPEEFERRRLEYHRTLQDEFFSAFEVTGTEQHVLKRGETLWYLAERRFQIPIWLLRQYNPELDFGALPVGVSMVVPVVSARAGGG
jgi:membrane-bound lytic murein transglycosylase D